MDSRSRSGALAGAGFALALHAGVIAVLLQLDVTRSAMKSAAPIVVRLIAPPQPERHVEQHATLPIVPRVHRQKKAIPPPPVITARAEAPSRQVAPPATPAPVPEALPEPPAPVATAVAPTPAPSPAPVPTPQGTAPPLVVAKPATPASFNADYLNNPAPEYPPLSRRLREEGKVILRVLVNEQGLPAEVQLKNSSGFKRLDSVALDTVKHWRFVPARRGSEPIAAWVLVPLSFTLRS